MSTVTNLFLALSRAYNELWHSAHVGIADLLTVEMPKAPPKPEKVRCTASERCNLTSAAQQRVVLCATSRSCCRIKWWPFRSLLQCMSSMYSYLNGLKTATIRYPPLAQLQAKKEPVS